MRRAELTRYWTPALLWAALLLIMSGNLGSGQLTGSALELIVSRTLGQISEVALTVIHFVFRKGVHVAAYGILGALDFRAVRGSRPGWRLRWSVIATVLAIIVAALDEWHQSMVPSRTGVPGDVVIDAIGATIAQLVWRRRALRRLPPLNASPETSSRSS